MRKVRLEICCSDISSVLAAKEGGADCIELCSSLETGGITPSAALIAKAVEIFPGAVDVLIRPRPGDFLYDANELDLILKDIEATCRCGASGIVCGALTADGDIDMVALQRMIEACDGRAFTFHRAFDLCKKPCEALEQLIDVGCQTILTSGSAPSAVEGVSMLKSLVEKSNGRIEIKAAAGISEANVAQIVKGSGATIVHASAKTVINSGMKYRNSSVSMGATPADEYSRIATSASKVAAIRKVLDTL